MFYITWLKLLRIRIENVVFQRDLFYQKINPLNTTYVYMVLFKLTGSKRVIFFNKFHRNSI